MKPAPPAERDTVRQSVIAFLAFITSDACLQACSRRFPPERLAFELCRLWIDDVYLPGTRYLDGLKGDYSAEAARRFNGCFTPDECAALERFHHFLELRMDMLSGASRRSGQYPQNDAWDNLRRQAAYVLDELAAHPEQLQSRLARIVEHRLDAAVPLEGPPPPRWLDELTG